MQTDIDNGDEFDSIMESIDDNQLAEAEVIRTKKQYNTPRKLVVMNSSSRDNEDLFNLSNIVLTIRNDGNKDLISDDSIDMKDVVNMVLKESHGDSINTLIEGFR